MKNSDLLQLIEKYLQGTCSSQERKALMDWYASSEDKEDFTSSLTEIEKQTLSREMLRNIEQNISVSEKKLLRASTFRQWYYMAACISLLVVAVVIYRFSGSALVEHQTAFGEIHTVTLPDSSVVTLNGNSYIRYEDHWQSDAPREIWLSGEAFFAVTHQPNDQRFVVHLSEGVAIEVLGTEFQAASRGARASVALKSGSVSLHIPSPLAKDQGDQKVLMQPGEVVTLSEDRGLSKTKDNIEKYFAWMQRKLLLNQTSLGDIITMLEDTHGLHLKVADQALLQRSASGSMPLSAEPAQVLNNITALYNVRQEKQGEMIMLYAQ